MLANCSTNLSLRIAKDNMDLEGRLIYHCRAGPIRVKPNPLYIVASRDSFGSATSSILYLYWAIWSSGSLRRSRDCFSGLGSYPWEPFHHGLHGVEPLGEHLLQVGGHRRSRRRSSLGYFLIGFWLGLAVFYVGLQSWHGSDLSLKAMVLVACRIEGLIFVSEDKVLRFELVELLGALLQLLGIPLICLRSSASLWVASGSSFCSSTAIVT
ncbi:hypothetical protein F2Q69_00023128 [Brassica cretica]|uniref:Uncharacterized protein n=1 Tax=Brassica cretica TaxID=69181 RepID=A0A8S9QR16_BRACR|nr:hypothetical protein F2Q69_00023128 [Brassica cretica]